MITRKRYDIDILMDERYDELKDVFAARNDDGDRWRSIGEMLEHDFDGVLEDLELSQTDIDAVVLGEARCLDDAINLPRYNEDDCLERDGDHNGR